MKIIGELNGITIVEHEGVFYQRFSNSGTAIFWRKSHMVKINPRSKSAVVASELKKEEIKGKIFELENGFFFLYLGMVYFRNLNGETKVILSNSNTTENIIEKLELEFQKSEEECFVLSN
uniref:Uncharacterized protein n=1 Tax=candidate division CPR3 bacterium TaxID=2268181 RepID=A0A7C4R654_UNCC3